MARDLTNIPPGQTDCSVCGFTKDNTEFSFYKERKTANRYRDWETDRKSTRLNSSH